MSEPCLVFAGGGTGGHVFPMLAVAEAVKKLAPSVRLVFIGTPKGLETKLVPERGYELELLDVLPLRGGGAKGALLGLGCAAAALPNARKLLKKFAPCAVFSLGGYAAGPVSLAARSLGVPVALMEPNAEIGLTNRLMAPWVQRAYTAYLESERHFRLERVLRSGVPIREGFEPRPYPPRIGPLRLLVFGGSQGAQALNRAVPEGLARWGRPLSVVHQCGGGYEKELSARYARLGLESNVEVRAFISDMPARLENAQLVIARAGASTLGEICAVGRPSVLVPYPHAGDHQRHNVEALVEAGAAICLLNRDANAERIRETLDTVTTDPGRLEHMAAAARRLGRPHAAYTVAYDLLALAKIQVDESVGEKSDRTRVSAAPPSPGQRLSALSLGHAARGDV